MIDVVALGELLIDFATISTDNEGYPTMVAHPGGAPANFLATLAKFGAKTALIGKVGNDTFGNMLVKTLENSGISTEGILIDNAVFTTLAFVTFSSDGDRQFSFSRKPGADTRLTFEEVNLKLIDEAKVFHFGTLSLTDEPARTATQKAVAYAKSKGKLITYDPNLRKPLWKDLETAKEQLLWGLTQADIIKISDDEAMFLFGLMPEEAAEHMLKNYNVKLVFITCGAKGCYFKNANTCGWVSALSGLKTIDTTGAGDIFGGSLVWSLLDLKQNLENLTKEQLEKIAKFSCTCAGLSTTKSGGISSIPTLEDVINNL